MTKLFLLPLLAVSICIFIGKPVNSQNIVVNGDLESWTAGAPDGWGLIENISQETTTVHGGSSSARHTSASTTKKFNQELTGIEAGQEYTISYWYFDNDPTAKTRIWSFWLAAGATMTENADVLRPNTYSTDNPDWQNFSVVLTAPTGADGFRFEVRGYQENSTSGGSIFYDDFEFTGDIIILPEPTNYPTDFSASVAGLGINLTWTDAVGTQLPSGYIIMAGINSSLPVPTDGEPVPNDTDLSDGSGALNVTYGLEAAAFSALESNTTYYFSIYPYTNGGANIDYKTGGIPPTVEATTSNLSSILFENFEDGTLGTFSSYSVSSNKDWINAEFQANKYAYENGYGGDVASDDWLISPALDLSNYTNEILTFLTAKNYTDVIEGLEILISEDYAGSGDPSLASWDALTATLSTGGYAWTPSGDIDLSSFSSIVYLAFHYNSTGVGAGEAAIWEVDDILITGEESGTVDPEPSNYPTNFSADASGSSILVSWTDAIGTQLPDQYIIFAGTSPTLPLPVDGTPVANDLDLSDGSGALNVAFGLEEATFSALNPGQTFYFVIYPYTNTGINTDYKTDGTAPTANATTTLIPEPSNYPTGFDANATTNSIALSWTDAIGGQLPEMYIIFAGTSSSLPVPVDGTPVANDLNLSDGSGVINVAYGIEVAAFAGLAPGSTFYFVIYPYTNSGTSINYKTDGTAPTASATTTFIPEPSNYPTGFGPNATSNSITLSWTDATGGELPEMYVIFAGSSASLPVPADGTPVADDLDLSDGSGAINVAYGLEEAAFAGLVPGSTFYFVIYPYTNSGASINFKTDGTAPTANATTINSTTVTINSEDFEDGTLGTWTEHSVASDKDWVNAEFSDNKFAKENGYGGTEPSDDWLLSPPLNLDNYINEILTFETAKNFDDAIEGLEVKISSDYVEGDPYQATWTTLTATLSPGNYEFTPSGDVDISSFNGTAVRIAFHYMSTGIVGGTATIWEVDNILITGEEDLSSNSQISLDENFRIYPNPSNGLINIIRPDQGFNKVTILSATGSLIEEFQISEAIYQKDFSIMNKGVYFILISDEQTGQTVAKKLILN